MKCHGGGGGIINVSGWGGSSNDRGQSGQHGSW